MDADAIGDAFDVGIALGHLTPDHRQVLLLTYGHDQTETQIASSLGIPVGTVKSRRFHALRNMAGLLGDPSPIAVALERGDP